MNVPENMRHTQIHYYLLFIIIFTCLLLFYMFIIIFLVLFFLFFYYFIGQNCHLVTHLNVLSVEFICCMKMLPLTFNYGIQTNNVDPDQTAHRSDLGPNCLLQRHFKRIKRGDAADDN